MAGINRTTGKATDLITFSRASGGTALRKISYGSELVTNGTFDSDTSGWSDASSGSSSIAWDSSSAINLIVVDNASRARASVATEIGKVYQVSVETTSGTGLLNVGTSAGAGTYVNENSIPVGVETFIFTAATTVTHIQLANVVIPSTATMDNISVKEVLFDQPDGTLTLFNHPTNIPRIEYDAAGNVKGLLIEEARTNLVTYSEDFTNASWVKTGLTVTANSSTSPDGSMTADLLTSSGSGTNRARVSTAMSGAHSYSIFAKAGTGSFIQILDGASGNYFANFDIGAGVVGGKGNLVTSSISDVGNGWYRCTMSTDGSVAGLNFNIYIVNNASAPYGSSSTSPDTVYVYGAQLEAGSFPTSYIPTSGATATRAADIASISVDNFGYNQKAGTVVVEADTFSTEVNNHQDFNLLAPSAPSVNSIHSGSRVGGGVAGQYTLWVQSGGSTVVLISKTSVISDNTVYKSAWTASENDFALTVDGRSVVTDTSGVMPSAATEARIGYGTYGRINGHIKSIAYYPRRLSNAQLQALTA